MRARPGMQQGSVRSVVFFVFSFQFLCLCVRAFFRFRFRFFFRIFFVEVSCFFLGGFEQSSTRLYSVSYTHLTLPTKA